MDELLARYLTHLMSKHRYKLVPLYTCRLSSDARRQVCTALLSELTTQGDEEARQTAVEELDYWFGVWRDQELGDVQPYELDMILEAVSFVELLVVCFDCGLLKGGQRAKLPSYEETLCWAQSRIFVCASKTRVIFGKPLLLNLLLGSHKPQSLGPTSLKFRAHTIARLLIIARQEANSDSLMEAISIRWTESWQMQVANEARWNPKTSLTLRTQSTAWLWLSPSTLSRAISHTNALLREFALGGEPAAVSAIQLLASLPAETAALLEGEVAVSYFLLIQLHDQKFFG